MKKDISNRADIELMVNGFYERVKTDPLIGRYFTDLFRVNWEKHLPVMYAFWENALFYTGGYVGNPMEIHKNLHRAFHFTPADFDRWNQLFSDNIDSLFEGDNARLAKQRALSISQIMQIKILAPQGQNSGI